VSIKIMSLVWDSEIGPASKRLVMLALADSASDEGVCWPSVATIARKSLTGLSTVRRVVAELEAEGLLERHERKRETGSGAMTNSSNMYVINAAKIVAMGAPTPSQIETPPSQNGTTPPPNSGPTPSQSGTHNRKRNHQGNREGTANPSGGAPAGAGPAPKPKSAKTEEHGLFDTPPPVKAPQKPAGAPAVVAAYVDAFRTSHGGSDPLRAYVGRVARDAAAMLRAGEATEGELTAAATAMGAGSYANLPVELNRHRDRVAGRSSSPRPAGNRGIAPARSHHDPVWAEMKEAADAERARRNAENPEFAARAAAEFAEYLAREQM
jgi:hypothetical protein